MVNTNPNINFSVLAIKKELDQNSSKTKEEQSFINDVENLITSLKNALQSPTDFSSNAYNLFNEVYMLRMKALHFLAAFDIDLVEISNEVLVEFDIETEDSNLENLLESVRFSIRSQKRVQKRFQKHLPNFFKKLNNLLESNPDFNEKFLNSDYDDSLTAIKEVSNDVKSPDDFKFNALNFISSSLMMEIGLMATDILLESNINVSRDKINEVSEMVVQNTQLYGASAIELGFFKKSKSVSHITKIDTEDLQNEQALAELGIQSYANQLLNE